MAKPPPPPLFSLKQDFVDSLEKASWNAINLVQHCRSILDLGALKDKPAVEARLRALTDAFEESLSK